MEKKVESDLTMAELQNQIETLDSEIMNTNRVVYAQVKGHPRWPAQIIPAEDAERVCNHIPRRGKGTAIAFFGTTEFAWVQESCTTNWETGIQKKHHMMKSKKFQAALKELLLLKANDFNPTAYPFGWWCGEEPDEEPEDEESQDEESQDEDSQDEQDVEPQPSKVLGIKSKNKGKISNSTNKSKKKSVNESDRKASPKKRKLLNKCDNNPVSKNKSIKRKPDDALKAVDIHANVTMESKEKKGKKRKVSENTEVKPKVDKKRAKEDGNLEKSKRLKSVESKAVDPPRPSFVFIKKPIWVNAFRPRPNPKDDVQVCSCPCYYPPPSPPSAQADVASVAGWNFPNPPPDPRPKPTPSPSCDPYIFVSPAPRELPRNAEEEQPPSLPTAEPKSESNRRESGVRVRLTILKSERPETSPVRVDLDVEDPMEVANRNDADMVLDECAEVKAKLDFDDVVGEKVKQGGGEVGTEAGTEADAFEAAMPPSVLREDVKRVKRNEEEVVSPITGVLVRDQQPVTAVTPLSAKGVSRGGRGGELQSLSHFDAKSPETTSRVEPDPSAEDKDILLGESTAKLKVDLKVVKRVEDTSSSGGAVEPPLPDPELEFVRVSLSVKAAVKRKKKVNPVKKSPPMKKLQPSEWTGCEDNCLNRSLMMFCDPSQCPSGATCSNRPFHLLVPPKVVPTYYGGCRGWGAKAGQEFQRGDFVIEYVGELINDYECEKRLWLAKSTNEGNFYMMEIGNDTVIDARRKANLARFLNSSCDPNCETQKWRDPLSNETRVGIFAIKDIAIGEELTYDYNFNHFGAATATSFRCECGAPKCRGTLDAKPEKSKDLGRRVNVLWDDNQYYEGVITKYNLKTKKHTVIYEDGDIEHIDLSQVTHTWLPGESSFPMFKSQGDVEVNTKPRSLKGKQIDAPKTEDAISKTGLQ